MKYFEENKKLCLGAEYSSDSQYKDNLYERMARNRKGINAKEFQEGYLYALTRLSFEMSEKHADWLYGWKTATNRTIAIWIGIWCAIGLSTLDIITRIL